MVLLTTSLTRPYSRTGVPTGNENPYKDLEGPQGPVDNKLLKQATGRSIFKGGSRAQRCLAIHQLDKPPYPTSRKTALHPKQNIWHDFQGLQAAGTHRRVCNSHTSMISQSYTSLLILYYIRNFRLVIIHLLSTKQKTKLPKKSIKQKSKKKKEKKKLNK